MWWNYQYIYMSLYAEKTPSWHIRLSRWIDHFVQYDVLSLNCKIFLSNSTQNPKIYFGLKSKINFRPPNSTLYKT